MPTKTIYLSNEQLEVWRATQDVAASSGMSHSELILRALDRYLHPNDAERKLARIEKILTDR